MIISKQKPSGAFEKYGDLFHKELAGGAARGAEEALTAYATRTLLDVNPKTDAVKASIDKALKFLKASYAEILVANTLVAAGEQQGETRVNTLLAKGTREGGRLCWTGDRSGPVGGSRAVDVEMTSYMVLSLLQLGGKEHLAEASRAVKWINAQRNSQGGFVSTQDTVVAMMALSEFAAFTFSSNDSVTVNVTALPDFSASFTVTPANRLVTQQRQLPSPLQLPNNVNFRISGRGCAVVQTVFRYNTNVSISDSSFNLTAVIMDIQPTCAFKLQVCTNFMEPNKTSNFAMVEIELISSFIAVESSLEKLKAQGGKFSPCHYT